MFYKNCMRDIIGTCYISFLVHPGISPCNTLFCWVLRDMSQNCDSDFSVVRDMKGTCYISFLVHPGISPCNTVAECFGICNKIVRVIFPLCVTLLRSSGGLKGRQAEPQKHPIYGKQKDTHELVDFLMVIMASGVARGHARKTAAVESCNMAATLQIMGWQRYVALVYCVLLWYWTSMLWSTDTCQNKVSADQYHVNISQAQVNSSSRLSVFLWSWPLTRCWGFLLDRGLKSG